MILAALKRKKGIVLAEGPYPYREDAGYSQIHVMVDPAWNADKLEAWLWSIRAGYYLTGSVDVVPDPTND